MGILIGTLYILLSFGPALGADEVGGSNSIHARKYSKFNHKEKIKIDNSCDSKLLYEHTLKQQCALGADFKACQSYNLYIVIAPYIMGGKLDRAKLESLVGKNNYDELIKLLDGFKAGYSVAQKEAAAQFAKGEAIWNEVSQKALNRYEKSKLDELNSAQKKEVMKSFMDALAKEATKSDGLPPKARLFFMSSLVDDPSTFIENRRAAIGDFESLFFDYQKFRPILPPQLEQLDLQRLRLQDNLNILRDEAAGLTLTNSNPGRLNDLLYDHIPKVAANLEKTERKFQKTLFEGTNVFKTSVHLLISSAFDSHYQFMFDRKMSSAIAAHQLEKTNRTLKRSNIELNKTYEERLGQVEKVQKALQERAVMRGGALDIAVAMSHVVDNASVSSCGKKSGLSDSEIEVLKAGWLSHPKAGNLNGVFDDCKNFLITDPKGTYVEMYDRFGGIPEGTCAVIKKSNSQLTQITPSIVDAPKIDCSQNPPAAVGKDFRLIKVGESGAKPKYELIHTRGDLEVRIPMQNLRAMSLNDIDEFRRDALKQNETIEKQRIGDAYSDYLSQSNRSGNEFDHVNDSSPENQIFYNEYLSKKRVAAQQREVMDSELEEDIKDLEKNRVPYFDFKSTKFAEKRTGKSLPVRTLAFKTFYQKFHPANAAIARPDLVDLSFDCSNINSTDSSMEPKSEADLFCSLRKAMISARQKLNSPDSKTDSECFYGPQNGSSGDGEKSKAPSPGGSPATKATKRTS